MADEADRESDYGTPIGTFTIFADAQPGVPMAEFEAFQETMVEMGLMREPEPAPGNLVTLFALVLQFEQEWTIFYKSGKLALVYAILLAAIGVLSVAAFILPAGLAQSYSIELASGAALFLAIPVALFGLTGRYKLFAWPICLIGAAAAAAGSFLSNGVPQSFCIEICVGILLLIALELVWAPMLKRSRKALKAARARS